MILSICNTSHKIGLLFFILIALNAIIVQSQYFSQNNGRTYPRIGKRGDLLIQKLLKLSSNKNEKSAIDDENSIDDKSSRKHRLTYLIKNLASLLNNNAVQLNDIDEFYDDYEQFLLYESLKLMKKINVKSAKNADNTEM